MRVFWAVLISGVCLGLSQPLVIEFIGGSEPILGKHGLLGLLSLIGYAPVIYYIRDASVSRAFSLSFFASLIHYSITLYWIVIACHVFGNVSLIGSVGIMLLLAAAISCYAATAFAVAQFIHRRLGISHLWVLPAAVCAVEYLRNYGIFGGFPWGNVGTAISQISLYLQSTSIIGVYGLVFVVVTINVLLAGFARERFNLLVISKLRLVAFAFLVIAPAVFGYLRISNGFDLDGRILKVALVQGNIEQGIKNKADIFRDEIVERYASLHREAVIAGAELIVWPESALPTNLSLKAEKFALPGTAPVNIIGMVLFDENRYYNSAIVVDKDESVRAHYHKSHLVPFGEYVPWPFETIASKIVPGIGAFRPGADLKPIDITLDDGTKLRLGLTICYEGVFPEITRAEAALGANLLVNMTNDAWYGVSSAPYQHLHMYRMRSVETGLPFVRATNTGVSAWVDPYGFVHSASGLYEQTIVHADVPLVQKPTLYLLVGDVVPQAALLLILCVFLFALFKLWRKALPISLIRTKA